MITTPLSVPSEGPNSERKPAGARYQAPGRPTKIFNSAVAGLTRLGVSVWGSRELQVVGRSTGELRTTPVNLMALDGGTFLVAPRGTTQWVRNLRAAEGHGQLRIGRRITPFAATEISNSDKVDVLRAYLRRWKFEVGVFFEGVDASSTDEEILAIAPGYPVFRLTID